MLFMCSPASGWGSGRFAVSKIETVSFYNEMGVDEVFKICVDFCLRNDNLGTTLKSGNFVTCCQ